MGCTARGAGRRRRAKLGHWCAEWERSFMRYASEDAPPAVIVRTWPLSRSPSPTGPSATILGALTRTDWFSYRLDIMTSATGVYLPPLSGILGWVAELQRVTVSPQNAAQPDPSLVAGPLSQRLFPSGRLFHGEDLTGDVGSDSSGSRGARSNATDSDAGRADSSGGCGSVSARTDRCTAQTSPLRKDASQPPQQTRRTMMIVTVAECLSHRRRDISATAVQAQAGVAGDQRDDASPSEDNRFS